MPLPRLAFFAPLIFSPDGTLLATENVGELYPDVTIPAGDKVVLSCAPNYFKKHPNEKVLEATCRGDKILGELLLEFLWRSFLELILS